MQVHVGIGGLEDALVFHAPFQLHDDLGRWETVFKNARGAGLRKIGCWGSVLFLPDGTHARAPGEVLRLVGGCGFTRRGLRGRGFTTYVKLV